MPKQSESLSAYLEEISDHALLGREGEIALAKEIENFEIEVWRHLLGWTPAVPLALEILEQAGIDLPALKALGRACSSSRRAPARVSDKELSNLVEKAARQIREHDRDRLYLRDLRKVIPKQGWSGKDHAAWRQGLRAREQAAASARMQFVKSNLRFVVSMSRRYAGRGVPVEDLIQEGNLGLIRGVDRFDYRRGCRFSTHASWWIRHAMGRAVGDTSRTVRVPTHIFDTHQRIGKAQRELVAELGRVPSVEEVAQRCAMTAEKVAFTRIHIGNTALSLDEPVGEEGTTYLDKLVSPANDERSVFDQVQGSRDFARVNPLLESLSGIQAEVLRKRFGLARESPMTLREIGEQHGLSRERIRQIESAALKALRRMIADTPKRPSARRASGMRSSAR